MKRLWRETVCIDKPSQDAGHESVTGTDSVNDGVCLRRWHMNIASADKAAGAIWPQRQDEQTGIAISAAISKRALNRTVSRIGDRATCA